MNSDGDRIATFCEAARTGDVAMLRRSLIAHPQLVHMDLAENDEHRAIHFAVLHRQPEAVRILMAAGSDARKGIYPHRDATSAYQLAFDRGFDEIVQTIDEEEQHRRESMNCPNSTVSPVQDQINAAIRTGDNDAAIGLLDADPTLIKACDRDGGTPLHVAAGALNASMVDALLARRASVTKLDIKDLTPLDCAVHAVDARVKQTLEKFVPIGQKLRNHGSPMTKWAAIALGDLDALRRLHAQDPKALSPVYWLGGPLAMAVRHRRIEVVRAMLDLGCDPDERTRLAELEEETYSWGGPLCAAASSGQYDIARLLLDRGADPNAHLYASGNPLSWAYSVKDDAMKRQLFTAGATIDPVTAAHEGDFELTIPLVEDDPTLLDDVMWGGINGASPQIVQWCLDRIDWPPTDPRWRRMLGSALGAWRLSPHRYFKDADRTAYPCMLRMLIAHGVDPSLPARRGETPLHECATCAVVWGQDLLTPAERVERATILLVAGARLDVRDNLLKSTPLGWAVRWGRQELVELYLSRGAPAHEPDTEPWATPLAWARRYKRIAIEEMLQ